MYKNVDLSIVDNGDFLVDLCQKRKAATRLLQTAKCSELNGESDGKIYRSYDEAYNAYSAVYNLIETSYEKLEKAKRKASRKDIITGVSLIIGIAGLIVGIIPLLCV